MRRQHRGERPSILPADRSHRRLVTRIHIRTLIAIDLDRNKILIDHLGQMRIFITFPIHHVTPVAPHRADIQQNGLVFPAARANASLPHSCHSTGWCMADRK